MIRKSLLATWPFFIIRAIAVIIISVIYVIVATQIQYISISLLGESTFNYIVFGLLGLFAAAALCSYVAKAILLLVNGWHIAAIPYTNRIMRRDVSSISVGYYAFKAHFLSFGSIFGLSIAIKKISEAASSPIRKMLEKTALGVAILRFSNMPLFENTIKDMMSSVYDCVIYYLVKYTKPGIQDDAFGIFNAVKLYLYTLPKIIATSLSLYLATNIIPKVVIGIGCVSTFINRGIVDALTAVILAYPIWMVLNIVIFRPLYVVSVLGCYAATCEKHQDADVDLTKSFVSDKIMNKIKEILADYNVPIPVDTDKEDNEEIDEEDGDIDITSNGLPDVVIKSNTIDTEEESEDDESTTTRKPLEQRSHSHNLVNSGLSGTLTTANATTLSKRLMQRSRTLKGQSTMADMSSETYDLSKDPSKLESSLKRKAVDIDDISISEFVSNLGASPLTGSKPKNMVDLFNQSDINIDDQLLGLADEQVDDEEIGTLEMFNEDWELK